MKLPLVTCTALKIYSVGSPVIRYSAVKNDMILGGKLVSCFNPMSGEFNRNPYVKRLPGVDGINSSEFVDAMLARAADKRMVRI